MGLKAAVREHNDTSVFQYKWIIVAPKKLNKALMSYVYKYARFSWQAEVII